jgi:hypothetical protein
MSIFKKKSFYIILVLVIVIAGYSVYVKIANDRYEAGKESTVVVAAEETGDIGRDNTYALYLEKYKEATRPETEITINLDQYSSADQVETLSEYKGEELRMARR